MEKQTQVETVIPFPSPPRVGLMRGWIQRIRAWVLLLVRSHLTPKSIAWAVAIGVFIGAVPLYGIHIIFCVLIARWLKLNQALVYAAANISNPLFAPFIIAGEVAVGEYIRYGRFEGWKAIEVEGSFWQVLSDSGDLVISCFVGSVPVGIVLAAVLGGITYLIARRWARNRLAAEGPPEPRELPEAQAADG